MRVQLLTILEAEGQCSVADLTERLSKHGNALPALKSLAMGPFAL